jgi:hypothetical protein
MRNPFTEFHMVWIEQCAATKELRERFGLESALDYLSREKIFSFVRAAEGDSDFRCGVVGVRRRNPAAFCGPRDSHLSGRVGAHQVPYSRKAGWGA